MDILSHLDRLLEATESGDVLQCGLLLRDLKQDWDLAALVCAAVHGRPPLQFLQQISTLVSEKGLIRIWEEKPLLNGAEIVTLVGASGPAVGRLLEQVWAWQILNRTGSKEACAEHIRSLHTSNPTD